MACAGAKGLLLSALALAGLGAGLGRPAGCGVRGAGGGAVVVLVAGLGAGGKLIADSSEASEWSSCTARCLFSKECDPVCIPGMGHEVRQLAYASQGSRQQLNSIWWQLLHVTELIHNGLGFQYIWHAQSICRASK